MVNLHIQLADAGRALSPTKRSTLTSSNPYLGHSTSSDVDVLCDEPAKPEMRQKRRAAKTGKTGTTCDGSIALFGQQSLEKREEEEETRLHARVALRRRGLLYIWYLASCEAVAVQGIAR